MTNYVISYQQHYDDLVLTLVEHKEYLEPYKYCSIIHKAEDYADGVADNHIHIILVDCGLTKNEILSFLPFADIQVMRGTCRQAYMYIMHRDKKSRKEGKTLYDYKDISWHRLTEFYLLSLKNSSANKEIDILNEIASDIFICVVRSSYDAIKKYGGIALKYSRSIDEMCYKVKEYHDIMKFEDTPKKFYNVDDYD